MSRIIDNLVVQYAKSLAETVKKRKALEKAVLASIRLGTFKSDHNNHVLVNTLANMRRRGVIENLGSRKNPIWHIKAKP